VVRPKKPLAVHPNSEKESLERFRGLAELSRVLPIAWQAPVAANALVGTLTGERRQPFTFLLHSIQGTFKVRCISPVGRVDPRADTERIAQESRLLCVVGAVYDLRFQQHDLTAEGRPVRRASVGVSAGAMAP